MCSIFISTAEEEEGLNNKKSNNKNGRHTLFVIQTFYQFQ